MKFQKRFTAWLLMLLIASLVGCGKVSDDTALAPTTVGDETETQMASNLYLAYDIVEGQKKFGYIDSTGEFVIEPKYRYGSDYSEGFAVVSDGNMYHVIDQTGKIIFENEGIIEPFKNGMAIFTNQATYKYGYIDTTGTTLIDPTYLMATPFNAEGTAVVSNTTDVLTVINKSGKSVDDITLGTEYTGLFDIKDGYALFINSSQEGSKIGVVSLDGQLIIPPDYNGITNLGNDNFAVKDPTREFYDLLDTPSAIFDKSGIQLTDYIYYDVKPYQGDYASASNATHTFFIGLDGNPVDDLPNIEGIGTLTFVDNLIKADIDSELSYLTQEGKLFWQANQTYQLTDGITIKQNKERLHRMALIVYPSISGLDDSQVQADINANLKSLFIDIRSEESLKGLSVEDHFDATLSGDLLTIHKSGYDYPSGAAHGMPIREYYQIDSKSGKFYTLKDLFVEKSNYLEEIDAILVESIQKRYDNGNTMVFPDSFKGLTEDTNFIITKDALIIYFYPYDIAAFAAGFQDFSIPYEDLKAIIDVDSALWNSFKH